MTHEDPGERKRKDSGEQSVEGASRQPEGSECVADRLARLTREMQAIVDELDSPDWSEAHVMNGLQPLGVLGLEDK